MNKKILFGALGIGLIGSIAVLYRKRENSISAFPEYTPIKKREMPLISKFIQATNYTVPTAPRNIKHIVIHTAETPEDANRAEGIARWVFAGPGARQASAHYIVDASTIVQCVRNEHIAWGAETANATGLHIEHAGYAKQSEGDWQDEYSQSMLDKSARLAAHLCDQYGIPPKHLTWQEFQAGEAGIVGHVDVNRARRGGSLTANDHWDPGPNFPWNQYISLVKRYMTNV